MVFSLQKILFNSLSVIHGHDENLAKYYFPVYIYFFLQRVKKIMYGKYLKILLFKQLGSRFQTSVFPPLKMAKMEKFQSTGDVRSL